MNLIIFDCEIKNLIPSKEKNDPNYSYCSGWNDFKGMGLSVIGLWRNFEVKSKNAVPLKQPILEIYLEDKFNKFLELVTFSDRTIGFNSKAFDDQLCSANGLHVVTDFDILEEIRQATGQPKTYQYGLTRAGYNLDSIAKVNLDYGKNQDSVTAIKFYQKGDSNYLINYCLNDVAMTKDIYFKLISNNLLDPTTGDRIIYNQ